MTFLDYLALLRRHWIAATIITLVVTISAMALVWIKNTQPFETTIFFSIGNEQNQNNNDSNIYDEVEAADAFSQTVQGWFKNPQFIEKLATESNVKTDISSRQQEKQNVVVTYSSSNEEQANTMAKTIKNELSKEIQIYDANTNDKFTLALFEIHTEKKPLSLMLFLLIGLLGGAVVAFFALYGYEYIFQRIISSSQITEIFNKSAIEKFPNVNVSKEKLSYLGAYIAKTETKNIQLIGINADTTPFSKNLEKIIANKTIHTVNFPQESNKIFPQNYCIAICILGKTTISDLRKFQSLIANSFDLIIIES